MRGLIKSLLWRNALVALALVAMACGLQLVSNMSLPSWLPWLIPVAFFGGLLWANAILFKQEHPVLAILLSIVLVPVMGFPAGVAAAAVGRTVADWRYRSEGVWLVDGCNGGAAVEADGEVRTLQQLIAVLADEPEADTNEIVHLKEILALAQEKARVLSDDCRWRGHRDTHPWKTNWSTIRRELGAAKERFYQ